MSKHITTIAALGTALTGSVLLAHQDDPKINDRQPAVIAPAYRADQQPGENRSLGFDSENVQLKSWLPLGSLDGADTGNDCWGYVSPSGREYALMGTSSSTVIVEITNPGDAQIVATLSGPNSLWRDIKTYGTYMYCVSEGGGGIQVFNLANIDNGNVQTLNSAGSGSTHNVAIDTESGFLYRTGGVADGMYIYSLANPAAPVQVGSWTDRYIHDAQVVTYTDGPYAGRQIAFCCGGFSGGWNDTGLTIVDVTNKSNPFVVGQSYYSGAQYSHQGWLSEDRTLFYLNDELDEQYNGTLTTTRVLNVEDLSNPHLVSTFTSGSTSIDHNLYTHNGMIFEANYRSGLRVFDASNPTNPVQYGYFDTYPSNDNASFNGLWNVYPYFPSGTVIGSDLESGLFVWEIGILDPCTLPIGTCATDVTGDGFVDVADILGVIDNWGDCGDGTYRPDGDVDGNCCVDVSDLLAVVDIYGSECVVTGACCAGDSSCSELSATDCAATGGLYSGDETTCANTTCPGAGDEAATAMTAQVGQNAYETDSATPSSPEPDESMCSGTYLDWSNSQDIWFVWNASFSGNAHFTTCDPSSYDTSMVLYQGSSDNQVACNGDANGDNGCQSYYSTIDFTVQAGTTYFIRIGGWQGATGSGTLTIE
ncbi:MAG TPA: choice-of-anchor B family protein [Phycisphaerales bacterium]|jgi:choice-of-anchor B domain-containing protein|nr:choice-of-anchor B family protein [Phycisphaerales bacterium]